MKKAAIFLADGFEEIEALTVVDVCRRAEAAIVTVSVTGKKEVVGSHQIPVIADCLYEELDFAGVDMIILPGGQPGTRTLEAYAPLMEQVDAFYQQGRFISAICAAPSILAHRGMLQGRDACSYPSFESHLAEGGAKVSGDEVVVSDHLMMARGMGCAIPFAIAIAERLTGKPLADSMKKSIVYEQRF